MPRLLGQDVARQRGEDQAEGAGGTTISDNNPFDDAELERIRSVPPEALWDEVKYIGGKPMHWVLGGEDGHQVVPGSLRQWIELFMSNKKILAHTHVSKKVWVSTIFDGVCINSLLFGGTPMVFETAIFVRDKMRERRRHASWDDAMRGHKRAIRYARRKLSRRAGRRGRRDRR